MRYRTLPAAAALIAIASPATPTPPSAPVQMVPTGWGALEGCSIDLRRVGAFGPPPMPVGPAAVVAVGSDIPAAPHQTLVMTSDYMGPWGSVAIQDVAADRPPMLGHYDLEGQPIPLLANHLILRTPDVPQGVAVTAHGVPAGKGRTRVSVLSARSGDFPGIVPTYEVHHVCPEQGKPSYVQAGDLVIGRIWSESPFDLDVIRRISMCRDPGRIECDPTLPKGRVLLHFPYVSGYHPPSVGNVSEAATSTWMDLDAVSSELAAMRAEALRIEREAEEAKAAAAEAKRLAAEARICPARGPARQATDLVVIAQSTGGPKTDFAFVGADSTTRTTSIVGELKAPTFLALSSGGPTVWDLSALDAAKITGVYATGRWPQGITGLPSGVPVTFRSGRDEEMTKRDDCPAIIYEYYGRGESRNSERIRRGFGRDPTLLVNASTVQSYDLSTRSVGAKPTPPERSAVRSESPVEDGPLPGEDGIRQLEQEGALIQIDTRKAQEMIADGRLVFKPVVSEAYGVEQSEEQISEPFLLTRSISRFPRETRIHLIVPKGTTMPMDHVGDTRFYVYDGDDRFWTDPAYVDQNPGRPWVDKRDLTGLPLPWTEWAADGTVARSPDRRDPTR